MEGNFKVEESRTYQFTQQQQQTAAIPEVQPMNPGAANSGVSADDTEFETPSIVGISSLPGTKATVIPASNGFYEKYVNNNKKSSGKPIREWYV